MKPALAWIQQVVTRPEDRKNRRWFATRKGKRVMEAAADLRAQVRQFKEECDTVGLAFATDREAWETFKKENPGAHLMFIGQSADAALDVVACRTFARYWRSEHHRQVHFDGNGTVTNAPGVMTVSNEDGTLKARTDPLQALFLEDPGERALAQVAIRETAKKMRRKADAYVKHADYLEKLDLAIEGGGVATVNEITGEIIVQAMLPGTES